MPAQIAAPGAWGLDADLNWGSSAIAQTSAGEALIVDAETHELRLTVGRGIAERWAVRVQLPWRYTGAGDLDSFIDNWHDFFSLPEGARRDFPRDQLRIAYERDATVAFDMQSSAAGLADISADVGYQLRSDDETSLAAWLSVKLPTGDAYDLTGSGAIDVTAAIAGERRFGDSWSAFGQLAMTWLGEGDLFPDDHRSVVWSGLAGIGVNVWRGLELKLQFDAHSAAVDDIGIDYLGDAVILTVGGAYRFASGWQLDLGVSEDIMVDASPDVVFVMGLRKGTGRPR